MTIHVPTDAIVVGVDGSEQSWEALRWAARAADAAERPLHLLHAEGALMSPYQMTVTDDPIDNICDEALGVVAHHHPNLAVSWSQPSESPVPALVDASAVASEIVLGSRGTGAVRGAVLGSVTTQVSTAAHCPVVVVRHPLPDRQQSGPIVVGVDGRPDGVAALDFAFAEAERRGLPLVAVLCWQLDRVDFASGVPMPGGDMKSTHRHHRDRLESALADVVTRHPEVRVTGDVVCAPTTSALVERSATASLLVVGTRGHHEMAGLVLGSVSQGVMRRSVCPVAVVPAVHIARSKAVRHEHSTA